MGEEEVEKAKKYLWKTLGTLRGAFLSFRIHIFLELEETGIACAHTVLLWKRQQSVSKRCGF